MLGKAAARKVAEKEAQAASAKAEVAESIPLPGKAASTSVQSESSGTPTGAIVIEHGKRPWQSKWRESRFW
eukprot:26172-Amphidinium_carterae.1